MVEYAPSNEPEANKRRSTRIVQAIPLTVMGVDALGQPFRERTSTLIVNCHGFKYQSKHYVLKGTWLELEIPNPESGQAPRKARGCVTFVQRPRTVKELFQVGVELEAPGNVWGIAFPPDDWVTSTEVAQVTELPAPAIPAPAAPKGPTIAPPPPTPARAAEPPLIPAAPPASVRAVPPAVTADISAGVKQQVSRMLAEAEGEIQKMAREATTTAVSREAASLLRELSGQMRTAAEKAVEQAASGYADQAIKRAVEKIEQARVASAQELRATWAREFEADLRASSQHLLAKLQELGESFRNEFSQQMQGDLATATQRLAEIEKLMREMHEQIAANANSIPGLIEHTRKELDALAEETTKVWSERLGSHTEKGRARLAELEEIAKGLHEKIESAAESAHSGWRQRLEKELAEASAQLENVLESNFKGAEERLASHVTEATANASGKLLAEVDKHATDIRKLVETAAAEAEKRVAAVRAALEDGLEKGQACSADIHALAARVHEQSQKLEALAQKAGDEVVRQFQEMLASNQEQLNWQAESVLATLAQRLEPALQARGSEMVSRVAAEVEKKVESSLKRADVTLKQLSELESVAAKALKREQERLQKEFEEASKGVLAKMVEELESKSTEATHTTFEQLYKSAEWYQRKAQTSMQAAFEKGITQAAAHLREKAAELSAMFGTELDHYSRSYTEHTQGMLEEAAKEASARLRTQMVETTDTSAAKFSDEVHRIAEEKLELMRVASGTATEETKLRVQSAVDSITHVLDTHAAQATEEFRQRVTERLRQGVVEARQEFQAQMVPVMETWRGEMKANQEHWLRMLEQNSGSAVEQYKQRLENVSNSWMVAAVTTLSQHSQGVLDSLAKAVEQRLRETCADVFAGVGENMRQRLLGMSNDLKKSG
jgi:hypothetical protein